MRHLLLTSVLATATLAATPALAVYAPSAALPKAAAVVPGQVLVRFKAAVLGRPGDAAAALGLKQRLGLSRQEMLLNGRMERLALPGYLRVEDAVAQLKANGAVLWAEPNYRKFSYVSIPNDPLFSSQWPLKNTGQRDSAGVAGTPGADMNLSTAWDANNDGTPDRTGDASVKLALVDDGFEVGHEDLAGNFIAGRSFNSDGTESADPRPGSSEDTHGTLVAGTAGAVGNNGVGISGPAWRVQMLPIRFGYETSSLVKAFDYARSQGAKVVNASFGGPDRSNAERDAIQGLRDADIVLVASAGNSDSNTDLAIASFPANYDLDNVVSVAANDRRDLLAGFSQFGPVTTDVSAPGVRIPTTAVGNAYATVSGTSFSSPYTAGVAALIRMVYPSADFREVKARLIEGAANPNSINRYVAGGRVDANASLNLSPRPSLVIQSVRIDDSASGDGDGALDAGETADAVITLQNLWQNASNISVSLGSNSSTIRPQATSVNVASLAKAGAVTVRLPLTVASSGSAHEVADLVVNINASGYSASRHFNVELGELPLNSTSNQSFGSSAQDEFQTFQIDVPAGSYSQLKVTSTASADIDIIVNRATPPQYQVSLDVDPDTGTQSFYTDAPQAQIGGAKDGNETVTVTNPASGTWFVTVVNYTQTANLPYTLRFDATRTVGVGTGSSGGSSSGSGGGGGGGALIALPLLLVAAARRRRWL